MGLKVKMASLVRVMGDFERLYALGELSSIGRASDCDIQLRDTLASRLHAVIQQAGKSRYRIIDKNSTNGTFVNGQQIDTCFLEDGAEILIGVTRFYFRGVGRATDARRWDERVSTDFPVQAERENGYEYALRAINISVGGLGVATPEELLPGEMLKIRLLFDEDCALSISARVIHYDPLERIAGLLCVFGSAANQRSYLIRVARLMREAR